MFKKLCVIAILFSIVFSSLVIAGGNVSQITTHYTVFGDNGIIFELTHEINYPDADGEFGLFRIERSVLIDFDIPIDNPDSMFLVSECVFELETDDAGNETWVLIESFVASILDIIAFIQG